MTHDFHRLAALSDQVSGVGVTVEPSKTFLNDPVHLEERLASLCADRGRHPVANDSRLVLGAAVAVASRTAITRVGLCMRLLAGI